MGRRLWPWGSAELCITLAGLSCHPAGCCPEDSCSGNESPMDVSEPLSLMAVTLHKRTQNPKESALVSYRPARQDSSSRPPPTLHIHPSTPQPPTSRPLPASPGEEGCSGSSGGKDWLTVSLRWEYRHFPGRVTEATHQKLVLSVPRKRGQDESWPLAFWP